MTKTLFSFGYEPRHDGNAPEITEHRWAVVIDLCKWYCSFGVEHQICYDGKWTQGTHYFTLSISNTWFWGSNHTYYDVPHCSFYIGPIHFSWSYWWCRKCMPDSR